MGKPNFSDAFKRDAVHQITVRGYAMREVSDHLGVSTHSLYQWMKKFPAKGQSPSDQDAEVRRIQKELTRVTQARDILN